MNLSAAIHDARYFPRKLSAARTRFDPVYDAISELVKRHDGAPGLTAFEYRVFSQNGEDGVLAEIFRRISPTNRFFVEFGIEEGWQGNSVFLADVLEWSGVFAEADPRSSAALAQKYQDHPRVSAVAGMVTSANVNSQFAAWGVPDEPDLVSIDIDGNDYYVWQALACRPRVLVIEYNGYLAPASELVQPERPVGWDGSQFFGASAGALIALGRSKGYKFVHADLTGTNLFFVRDDCALSFAEATARIKNQALLGLLHRKGSAHESYVVPEK